MFTQLLVVNHSPTFTEIVANDVDQTRHVAITYLGGMEWAVLFRNDTFMQGFTDRESAVAVALQIATVRMLQDHELIRVADANRIVASFV